MQFLIDAPTLVGLREIMEIHRFEPCSDDYRDALAHYFKNPQPEPIDDAIDTWRELGVDVKWAQKYFGISGSGSGSGFGDGYGYGSSSGSGSGSGFGDGYGYGSSSGYGSGSGYGYGYGSSSGYGSGSGYGYGSGSGSGSGNGYVY